MFTNTFFQFEDSPFGDLNDQLNFKGDEDLVSLGWSGDDQINLLEEFERSSDLLSTFQRNGSSASVINHTHRENVSFCIEDETSKNLVSKGQGKGSEKQSQKKRTRRPKCEEKKKQKLIEQKEKLRMDVISKGILRMIRRFFHRIFTEENNDILQKRFINYEFSELMQRIEKMLLEIGLADDHKNMAIFLFQIFRINSKDTLEGDSEPFKDAEVVNAAMTGYTRAKYALVHK